MKTYILASACISPQQSFTTGRFHDKIMGWQGNRLRAAEPDYSPYIDSKAIRRMSRIIKMGTAAAMECLQRAAITMPGAIVMGTAYGCLEDTGVFLKKMIGQQEEMLTPTAFIQSTHNTIGAQIALLLQCHHYNNTFVHRGFSFERALQDAMMLLEENAAAHVLTGAADEITDASFDILSRFGLYKRQPVSDSSLFSEKSTGTIAGEGAAFFLLTGHPSPGKPVLEGLHTFYKPVDEAEVLSQTHRFLEAQHTQPGDIDLLILGRNGDAESDEIYTRLRQALFTGTEWIPYKQLSGEYPTSTAFALWLAAEIAKDGHVPHHPDPNFSPRKILLYNHYDNIHHSFMLVTI